MREINLIIENLIKKLAKSLAMSGVLVLCFVAIMVLISIIGRALIGFGFSPIKGDFELVEAGSAFAVLAFMPYCQLHRAHAQVDFITDRLGKTANRTVDFISDFLFFLLACLLAWRHSIGTLEKFNTGESSFILQFSLYWAYGLSLIALYIWVLVALWILSVSFSDFSKKLRAGRRQGA